MSVLTITTFQPQISWPYGGSTATLRIKYSANFTDSTSQVVLRGLYKNVPCTIAGGVLTVPQFTLITTNDALVNPLVTCSAQFFDSTSAARDWLFQNFSIPQSLTPSASIASLFTYNQGAALVLPPDFYLNREQVTALVNTMLAMLGFGPATDLILGMVKLSIAAADPANPQVWGTNDPLVRDALKLMGVELDATMAAPADTNVPVFDSASGKWKPGLGAQGAAGGDLSGTYPNPSVVDDSHLHTVLTLVGLGALALLSTVGSTEIDDAAVTLAKIQDIPTDSLIGRDTAGSGEPESILLDDTLSMDGAGNLQRAALTGDITAPAGSNTTTLADTAVTPGSYTNTNLTVDSKGRITTAANGSAGGPATQIEETSGPTVLDVAGITDGEFLKRVGTDIVSAAVSGGSTDVLEVQVFS